MAIALQVVAGAAVFYGRRLRRAANDAQREHRSMAVELQTRTLELELALAQVRSLQGMLAICSCCKSIRDPEGSWRQMEEYLELHFQTDFSHAVCPECLRVEYPSLFESA